MNIPDTTEKSKSLALAMFKKSFLPVFVLLIGFGGYGLGKLYKIEHSKVPIIITESAVLAGEKKISNNLTENPVTNTEDESSTSTGQINSQNTVKPAETGKYVASRGGTVYYLPTCSGAKRISEKNKIWFTSKEEAERLGYKPSKSCKGI